MKKVSQTKLFFPRRLLFSGSFFEQNFSHEILESEKKRSLTLLALSFSGSCWMISVTFFFRELFPPELSRVFYGLPLSMWLGMIFFCVAVYEALFSGVLAFFIRRRLNFPVPPRFANAFVEISIPTMLIFFLSKSYVPHEALFQPVESFYFLFIALSALRMKASLCFFTGGAAALEYLALSFFLLGRSPYADSSLAAPGMHAARAIVLLLAGFITGIVAIQIKKRLLNAFNALQEKESIVSMFGRHLSPEVVSALIDHRGDIAPVMRNVCVMFLDIRGFTKFSLERSPEEVMTFLNGLFDFMIDIIHGHNGIINKFLGDGFMAVFGAPVSDGREAHNAVKASLEIVERLKRAAGEGAIPETRIGIGIHSGPALTGNVGSHARMEYTVIGDVVNLASRIEQVNKRFDSTILISQNVHDSLADQTLGIEDIGPVEIRGLHEPVRLYKIKIR